MRRPAALPRDRNEETVKKTQNFAPRDVRARKCENAPKRCTYPPFHESGPDFHGARRGRRESFS